MAGLTSEEVAAQAGVSYRQLDYWVRVGWLHPEGKKGSGRQRTWPEAEIDMALAMGALVKYGVDPALAFELASCALDEEMLAVLRKLPRQP